jgi:hypothetical protein
MIISQVIRILAVYYIHFYSYNNDSLFWNYVLSRQLEAR